MLAAIVLLVAGASVAAYAALSRHRRAGAPRTLALRPPVGTATGTTPTTPTAPGATTPTAPGVSGTSRLPAPPSGAAPPKIPTQTPTPEGSGGGAGQSANSLLFPPEAGKGSKATKSSKAAKTGSSGGKGSSEGVSEGGGGAGSSSEGASGAGSNGAGNGSQPPTPILLDTNAASTYNPNAYPSSLFGDPSLAIDGEASTAWTAGVEAAIAPRMAEGIVLDLKTAQKLASLKLKTSTTGFSVEIYGANGHALPATIADPAWKRLHGPRAVRRKSVAIKLATKGAAYRFVLLWLVKAPPGSTAAAPGQVAIGELELFPPKPR
jgi:hypothetical protein